MRKELLKQYEIVVSFLGKTLGPCYEVVLHEVKADEIKMIAIANGEISGRIEGSPISKKAIKMIEERQYKNSDEVLNYTVELKNGKKIRSSTMFIKENNKIIGMLCINFDDTVFQNINSQILRIIHPDLFVKNYLSDVSYNNLMNEIENIENESSSKDIHSLIEEIYQEVAKEINIPIDRISKEERQNIVNNLYERGLFSLKGSVPYTAKKLKCSETSVYRYVSQSKKITTIDN